MILSGHAGPESGLRRVRLPRHTGTGTGTGTGEQITMKAVSR